MKLIPILFMMTMTLSAQAFEGLVCQTPSGYTTYNVCFGGETKLWEIKKNVRNKKPQLETYLQIDSQYLSSSKVNIFSLFKGDGAHKATVYKHDDSYELYHFKPTALVPCREVTKDEICMDALFVKASDQ